MKCSGCVLLPDRKGSIDLSVRPVPFKGGNKKAHPSRDELLRDVGLVNCTFRIDIAAKARGCGLFFHFNGAQAQGNARECEEYAENGRGQYGNEAHIR